MPVKWEHNWLDKLNHYSSDIMKSSSYGTLNGKLLLLAFLGQVRSMALHKLYVINPVS